jgi:hypothetical protein
MSIPLAVRKEIKESLPKSQAYVESAGKSIGMTLQYVDQYAEFYTKLGSQQSDLCSGMEAYYEQLAKVFAEFAQDPLRLEALKTALARVNGKIVIKQIPASEADTYWGFSQDGLEIIFKEGAWGSWISYFSADELEKKLSVPWEGNAVSLVVKKSISDAEKEIAGHLARASAAYGKPLSVASGSVLKVYNAVKNESNGKDAQFGLSLTEMVKQAADTIISFCSNADNKEALQDAWKTNQLDFVCNDDDWKYWIWQNGSLCMQIKKDNFGSWISYYNADALEKTL